MRIFRKLSFLVFVCLLGGAGWLLVTHPGSPLPREWNPTKRLYVSDPVTPLTPYKLDVAANDMGLCREVLAAADVDFTPLKPLRVSAQCHVENHVLSLIHISEPTRTY